MDVLGSDESFDFYILELTGLLASNSPNPMF